jgi:succinate dehydrogenase / fumarate reductase iron-sulfur subunit
VEFQGEEKIKKFKPRKPDFADGTWKMAQEDINRVQEFRKCIECYLCQDVCHVLREHQLHERFIGRAFWYMSLPLKCIRSMWKTAWRN